MAERPKWVGSGNWLAAREQPFGFAPKGGRPDPRALILKADIGWPPLWLTLECSDAADLRVAVNVSAVQQARACEQLAALVRRDTGFGHTQRA